MQCVPVGQVLPEHGWLLLLVALVPLLLVPLLLRAVCWWVPLVLLLVLAVSCLVPVTSNKPAACMDEHIRYQGVPGPALTSELDILCKHARICIV